MRYASDFLNTKNVKRIIKVKIEDVTQNQESAMLDIIDLEVLGIDTTRPSTRSECPTQRPCPFVGCRYNLFLDVMSDGNLRLNFGDIDPWEMNSSCALDITDDFPEGLKFSEISKFIGLSREKVRQIEKEALKKIKDNVGEKELRSWLIDLHKSKQGHDIYIEDSE
jgi:hypothetical protein